MITTRIHPTRAGEAQLESMALPTRKHEPYRYTDLESLYRTDFELGPAKGTGSEAAAIEPYLLEESKGQQMVFVNGVFSAALSDVSALGGVDGLVAGNVGAMEGAQLDQVCCVKECCGKVQCAGDLCLC